MKLLSVIKRDYVCEVVVTLVGGVVCLTPYYVAVWLLLK